MSMYVKRRCSLLFFLKKSKRILNECYFISMFFSIFFQKKRCFPLTYTPYISIRPQHHTKKNNFHDWRAHYYNAYVHTKSCNLYILISPQLSTTNKYILTLAHKQLESFIYQKQIFRLTTVFFFS